MRAACAENMAYKDVGYVDSYTVDYGDRMLRVAPSKILLNIFQGSDHLEILNS